MSSTKIRLDKALVQKGFVDTRSQAESWIRLGRVKVNGVVATKQGLFVEENATIILDAPERYVSRAGLKLASVARGLSLTFENKIVLDVGSSTGGFTDYALQHGARKVIAVDVGTDQLHPSLHGHAQIELHEKTDIRDFIPSELPEIVVIDVSFVSLKRILPHVARISNEKTQIVAMVKPQFEARHDQITRGGIVKNDRVRREILKEFEAWAKQRFMIIDKADSDVAGTHGNRERFYLLGRMKVTPS